MTCIPKTFTEENIRKLFEPFGSITEVFLIGANPLTTMGTGVPLCAGLPALHRGQCMLNYDNARAPYYAIHALNNKIILPGCSSPMFISLARGWEHLDLQRIVQDEFEREEMEFEREIT